MRRRSSRRRRGGFTVMILTGPGKHARRMQLSERGLAYLLGAWASAMLVAAYLGFISYRDASAVSSAGGFAAGSSVGSSSGAADGSSAGASAGRAAGSSVSVAATATSSESA